MPSPEAQQQPQQGHVVQAEAPSLTSLLSLAIGVVVVAGLALARDVLIPITLALLLSFVLVPLAELLRRIGLGRTGGALLAALLALCLILALGTVIASQVGNLAQDLPRYQATMQEKLSAARDLTVGRLTSVLEQFGRGMEEATSSEPPAPTASGERPVPVEVRPPMPSPIQVAERVLMPALGPLATTFIVFVVAVFALLQRQDLRDRLIRLFGSRDLHRTTVALDDAARRLSRYFLTQLGINTAYGIVTTGVLLMIGVPGAALWGILAGLMRFVPFIGTPIAAIPPIVLAAAVDPGWTMALWTTAFFVVGEGLMGQVVEPLAFGQSTGLSPLSVVVAAIFWTWLWGAPGLLLATPLTVCLAVLGRHIERLEFLGVMLADRPALTPSENFYQRMLARDPDEAQDHAERILKERSLISYYDEVALKGLQLAAADAKRGILSGPRLEGVKETMLDLVEALSDQEDVPREAPPAKEGDPATDEVAPRPPPGQAPPREALPPRWQGEAPVLCIAGRGPLDEAAAAMLTQLLGKHGLGARLLPHERAGRAAIRSLDTEGVAMVCISYLDISGNPAHLRLLLRRLRARLPKGAPILVGLWPAEDAILTDRQLQIAVGADRYVTTLSDAVETCLDEARKSVEAKKSAA
ncbi:AI-2E family transporter [Sabulicella glaciei]|uniref:AI-2E family transporter n=1 Tax=Sabulicella glaciei TaxID=2984948 RepID=A0ABT3NSW3_9PROT|nr:AI-2E family transporter [Roseococcus sp. MDT2-1-1]MCW8085257.1 AI-2E family transporter [Roseococcus sp. MDT2-1-1]